MAKSNWIQTGILVATLLAFAFGAWQQSKSNAVDIGSRLSRVEQRMDDRDKDFADLLTTVHRIEDRLK